MLNPKRLAAAPVRTGVAAVVLVAGAVVTGVPGAGPGAGAADVAAAATCPTASGAAVQHATAVADMATGGCPGYIVTSATGQVSPFGAATSYGDLSAVKLAAPIDGAAATSDGRGYYLLGADGGIFSFGDARFFGSTGNLRLNQPVVGMAVTPDGGGYWLVAGDGGVFSFGDAAFYGSTGNVHLSQPVVGMAATADGHGYWLVAADGGIFSFGDAAFHGSTGGVRLARPVVGMSPSADGGGYDLVASDGGVFSFGDARFYGSLGSQPPAFPVVGISPTPDMGGYTLVDEYGQVFTFGDAPDLGSAACPVNASSLGADPNLMDSAGGGSQLITVVGQYSGSVHATLTAWGRRADGCWLPATLAGQAAFPYVAEVGYNPATGANLEDHRSEGDGSTPTGIYDFESTMYGLSSSAPNPGYSYHQLVCGDWWDEQPGTPQYNEFVHVACGTKPPFGGDSEALWTETVAYQHFAVINFNPPPTSDPIGSGVFFHDDTTSGYTAGCVALPPGQLDAVLGWLDPADSPHIAIGTSAEMASF